MENGRIIDTTRVDPVQEKPQDDAANPSDNTQGVADLEHLSRWVMDRFRSDMLDREECEWKNKREYDVMAYYGLKKRWLSLWPWKNAANNPQCLTPALMDTLISNLMSSQYAYSDKLVRVEGIGVEDERPAPILEQILNMQLLKEIKLYSVQNSHLFKTFLHGTNHLKVLMDFQTNKVKVVCPDTEDMFLPLDASGCQKGETDHVGQMLPFSFNDIQYRKGLGIYKDLDKIPKGWNAARSMMDNSIISAKDAAAGTSKLDKFSRDTYFMLEWWGEYYEKDSFRAKELAVWISPMTGTIHRLRVNQTGVRPFSEDHAFPYHDRYWSMSFPEKIRNEQEELDYAAKQLTDTVDINMQTPAFMDDGAEFDADLMQRKPAGIYKKTPGSRMDFAPQLTIPQWAYDRLGYIWDMAERKCGVTELVQGVQSGRKNTATSDTFRVNYTEVRFSEHFDRSEEGFAKAMNIIYCYDDKYMDRSKKIKLAGYSDYQTIGEIFKTDKQLNAGFGLEGNFDFYFAGKPKAEQDQERENERQFLSILLPVPKQVVQQNWKAWQELALNFGYRKLSTIVPKPMDADLPGAEEAIQRIMSGQIVDVRPGIDTMSYFNEINYFMRTDMYAELTGEQKYNLDRLMQIVLKIHEAETLALADVTQITRNFSPQPGLGGLLPNGQPEQPGAAEGGRPTQAGAAA